MSNLRVFGFVCYTWIPEAKRGKLDEKAYVCVFVGYSLKTKGYRVFNPATGKVSVSRDVKFNEEAAWNWETNQPDVPEQLPASMQQTEAESDLEEFLDDAPVRGTRSIDEVYQRSHVALLEPENFEEAAKSQVWSEAMKEEISMIEKNETWKLVERPQNKNVIGVRWVYRTKLNPDGTTNKHKARLVVKGYAQHFGADYTETFAPVARLDTIRLLIALAAQNQWRIYQLDVKSAFLNGYLQEEIFVEQPDGFQVKGSEDKVFLLKKALYGLKQAPRAWYDRISCYLVEIGFNRSPNEPTLFVKAEMQDFMIVSVYVDDLLVCGSNSELVNQFKLKMAEVFEMTDLGEMAFFLGMEIKQSPAGIFIGQQKYTKEILKKFEMENCKSVNTPLSQGEKLCKEDGSMKVSESVFRSLIGCLLYLTATRPDIMYAVSLLSRFMHSPSEIHFKAAKRVLRYVKGTLDFGMMFKRVNEVELVGYTDSDWAGSEDDMRSTSGFLFTFGSAAFTWNSKKQQTVAQSTAEAEYIAAAAAVNHAVWLKKMLLDIKQGVNKIEAVKIMIDNQSAIAIAKNPIDHKRTKHFKIKFHFVREMEQEKEISLVHCSSNDQLADILTKALPKAKFEDLRKRIGCCKKPSKEEC